MSYKVHYGVNKERKVEEVESYDEAKEFLDGESQEGNGYYEYIVDENNIVVYSVYEADFQRYEYLNTLLKGKLNVGDKIENYTTLEDYVKWIAKQNVIQLDDNQIKKFTNWLIENKKYNEVVEDLIEMMRQVERKDR